MERRDFLMSAGLLAAAGAAAPAVAAAGKGGSHTGAPIKNPKGAFLDLATPVGNREAWARLLGNTDMTSTKYGWAQGVVLGVRPGEAIRDLVGFTMLSCAKLLPHESGSGYRKVLREIGLYTDLKSGEILEEWTNPYFNETVKVVPIANDPFNHEITEFRPAPPSYGGLNRAAPPRQPLQFDWTKRGDTLNLYSAINLFYPSALQPAKWPRESAVPFAQVTESFLYQIPWEDMQDAKKTSVEYHGTWSRTTPWLPWMLMGPTPGHCQYQTFMGSVDDINKIDRRTLDYIEKTNPKYLKAPDKWEEPSLSSLEWYARTQQPAPVPAGQPVPRAPDPELPAWFKAMQAQKPAGS
ncbi:MAG: DUF1838 family protein [Alphaproteobacteria bacterium]|nr:DUF1838 family protein [Alphaproteobacteria bacterium]